MKTIITGRVGFTPALSFAKFDNIFVFANFSNREQR